MNLPRLRRTWNVKLRNWMRQAYASSRLRGGCGSAADLGVSQRASLSGSADVGGPADDADAGGFMGEISEMLVRRWHWGGGCGGGRDPARGNGTVSTSGGPWLVREGSRTGLAQSSRLSVPSSLQIQPVHYWAAPLAFFVALDKPSSICPRRFF